MDTEITYYIGTGEKTMMYTLRHQWLDTYGEYDVVRDHHIQNLSINKDRAHEKALAILPKGAVIKKPEFDLEEIRSLEAKEVQHLREIAEQQYEEAQGRYRQDKMSAIASGRWPFGVCKGEKFADAQDSYTLFMMTCECDADDIVMTCLQDALKKAFPKLANLPKASGEFFGVIKKRYEFKATLIKSFCFETFYGWMTIEQYVSETGELLHYKGSAPKGGDLGEIHRFKATVKAHDEYKGTNQTHIQRISML